MKSTYHTNNRSATLRVEPFLLIGLTIIIITAVIFRDQTPSNLVVLLEDLNGKTGSVVVSTKAGKQVLDKTGAATGVSSGSETPQNPFILKKSEINELFGGAIEARPPLPASFTLYFEPNSSRLTAGATTDITKIIREIRQRSISNISIIGHADRTGSVEANVKISLRRAEVVRQALISAGLKRRGFKIDSFGDRDPVIPTGPGVAEPRNRRVEVIVR